MFQILCQMTIRKDLVTKRSFRPMAALSSKSAISSDVQRMEMIIKLKPRFSFEKVLKMAFSHDKSSPIGFRPPQKFQWLMQAIGIEASVTGFSSPKSAAAQN
jgi:hypothetical protein